MICIHCGIVLAKKVCEIHQENCPKGISEKPNTIGLSKHSKTDLVVLILSESNEYKEGSLKRLKKDELLEIALKLK